MCAPRDRFACGLPLGQAAKELSAWRSSLEVPSKRQAAVRTSPVAKLLSLVSKEHESRSALLGVEAVYIWLFSASLLFSKVMVAVRVQRVVSVVAASSVPDMTSSGSRGRSTCSSFPSAESCSHSYYSF